MSKVLKKVFKAFLGLAALFLAILLVVGSYFGVKGYMMYREAVNETPPAEKVSAVRSMEHFTEYDELPEFYIDAVISVEDQRFESHSGIDLLAIGRAVISDIRSLSLAQGGSTITQQIAKNMYFTQEKKLERKVAEVFVAFDLEEEYSKEDIFELYVNTIYFGSGYYGIYEAAQGYFGKQPAELSNGECAMLAGLPNAPTAYSPDTNPGLAKERMAWVLQRMVACGKLTEEEKAMLV